MLKYTDSYGDEWVIEEAATADGRILQATSSYKVVRVGIETTRQEAETRLIRDVEAASKSRRTPYRMVLGAALFYGVAIKHLLNGHPGRAAAVAAVPSLVGAGYMAVRKDPEGKGPYENLKRGALLPPLTLADLLLFNPRVPHNPFGVPRLPVKT